MMLIRKVYKDINPELLYHEVRDFTRRRGGTLAESKMETYSLPSDSSSFISSGTLVFQMPDNMGETKEAMRVHIVGSAKGETRLMMDVDDAVFPDQPLRELLEDLDFIFGAREVKKT